MLFKRSWYISRELPWSVIDFFRVPTVFPVPSFNVAVAIKVVPTYSAALAPAVIFPSEEPIAKYLASIACGVVALSVRDQAIDEYGTPVTVVAGETLNCNESVLNFLIE